MNVLMLVAMLLLLAAPPAYADALPFETGALILGVPNGIFGNVANQSLVASGPGFSVNLHGFTGGGIGCTGVIGCEPGASLRTNDAISIPTQGTITVQGVTHDLGQDNVSWAVTAPPIVLPPLAANFSATIPFSLRLECNGFPCVAAVGAVGTFATGQGTATFSFLPLPQGGQWKLVSGEYDFAPVPEPSTWLLALTGLGLLAVTRFRRRLTLVALGLLFLMRGRFNRAGGAAD